MELTFEEIRKLKKDAVKLSVIAEYLNDQSMPAMARIVNGITMDLSRIVGLDNYIDV